MFKRKKIGLALGSGAARGYAHVGVLKVLEKFKIPIHMISGSSMGAVAGALYAANPDAKRLEKLAYSVKWRRLIDITIPKYGLMKGEKIEDELRKNLGKKTFRDLKIPLYITALDIENEKEIIFNKGDVVKAVRASVSIPGIFNPVVNRNRVLIDGGFLDPLPIKILKKQGADIIIAVNLLPIKEEPKIIIEKSFAKKEIRKMPNIMRIFLKTMQIMEADLTRSIIKRTDADVVIHPDLRGISQIDFNKVRPTINAGEKAALEEIEKIKKITKKRFF